MIPPTLSIHLPVYFTHFTSLQGKCIDTTMGVTPLEGLVMATRCGDIDPAIPKILSDLKGLSLKEIDGLMNKQSGLLGVAGDKDMRSVVEGAAAGEERAKLALDVFVHRVRKYLGAYYVHLGESSTFHCSR